jgi:hypothetical protein
MYIGKTDLLGTVGNPSLSAPINCLDCSLPECSLELVGTPYGAALAYAGQSERDQKAGTNAVRNGKLEVLIEG